MQDKNDSLGEKRPSLFMQWWDGLSKGKKDLLFTFLKAVAILFAILVFSILATMSFSIFWVALFGHDFIDSLIPITIEDHLALSSTKRNSHLLFFGIFAISLAVWGRLAQQKQLKHTEKQIESTEKQISNTEEQLEQTREQLEFTKQQIENSLAANRNDRYTGAVGMLEKDKSEASYRGGLYMLGELMIGGNEAECTLYGETITDWLKSADMSSGLKTVALKLLVE